jgi:caa(3)-type oxidase subunit IV
MSAEHHEDLQQHVKKYVKIGIILGVFTIITVALSYWELPTHGLNIVVGMIVAAFKAALVGLIFMHLNHERSLIYKVLLFTLVFVIGLFVLTYFSHENPLVFKSFDGYAPGH